MSKIFVEGPISSGKIAGAIDKHKTKTGIGAHDIFMGQVRADEIDGKIVQAIEFSAYQEMAEQKIAEIREVAFQKFDLTCLHIYHSLGAINVGEICFFIMASSGHRGMAMDANRYLVEEIKSEVPIFGKELFDNESYVWKTNK